MIVELFKSGMSLAELSSEYGIVKSTINKENKGIYGDPRIHHILGIEGFNVALKRVQRLMTELGLCAVTVKKYKHHSSKKVAEDLDTDLGSQYTSNDLKELYKEFKLFY